MRCLLDKKNSVDSVQGSSPGIKVILVLLFSVLLIFFLVYEGNATKLLIYGKGVEEAGKYEVAVLGYSTLIEKYPMSFSVISARKGLSRIEKKTGMIPVRSGGNFLEMELGDPFVYYMFPIVMCGSCAIVSVLLSLWRMMTWRSPLWTGFLGMIAAALTLVQLFEFEEGTFVVTDGVASSFVAEPLWLYIASCVLAVVVGVTVLSIGLTKRKSVGVC